LSYNCNQPDLAMPFNYNFDKSRAAILYIAKTLGGSIDYHYFFKILYYANKKHLANYGRPVVADKILAMEYGPVTSNILNYLNELRHGNISDPNIIIDNTNIKINGKPDLDEFSKTDLECINDGIKNVSRNFNKRTQDSHDTAYKKAWEKRGDKKCSEMNFIEIAEAGGADKEMLDYIKECNESGDFILSDTHMD